MSTVAPAWSPTREQMQSSRLWRFMREHQCATYPQLCERAARDPDWFWDALVKELGVVWSRPYRAVMDTSAGLPFTRWFPGGLLNAYDSAVLRRRRSPFLGLRRGSDPPATGRRRRTRADHRGRRHSSRARGRDEADRRPGRGGAAPPEAPGRGSLRGHRGAHAAWS